MSAVSLKNSVSSGKIIGQSSRVVGRSPDSGLYRCRYTSEGFNLKWLGIRTYVEINFTSYEFYMSLVELDVSHFQTRLSKKALSTKKQTRLKLERGLKKGSTDIWDAWTLVWSCISLKPYVGEGKICI